MARRGRSGLSWLTAPAALYPMCSTRGSRPLSWAGCVFMWHFWGRELMWESGVLLLAFYFVYPGW